MTAQSPKTKELKFIELGEAEMRTRALEFNAQMQQRRTVRDFSSRSVPRQVIDACLEAADIDAAGKKQKNYYVTESASMATGMLITALHNAGLATLTHTPSPMKFLNKILDRPTTEKPLMVVVTGYPETGARVPDISRKPFGEFVSIHE